MWAAVLGDRLIHLKHHGDKSGGKTFDARTLHIVCKNDCAEDGRDRISPGNGDVERPQQSLHEGCQDGLIHRRDLRNHERSSYETLHLQTLQVCRQFYNEGTSILWSTNTFSFSDGRTLDHFMRARGTHQKELLRRLRLQMDRRHDGDNIWGPVLDMKLIRSLTGLRSLRLRIIDSMKASLHRELRATANEMRALLTRVGALGDELKALGNGLGVLPNGLGGIGNELGDLGNQSESNFPRCMRRLATLPFREVEVFVSSEQRVRYRGECAEGLREMLLDPKGAEKYVGD